MVVIAICGVMGKGKTATATYMAAQYYAQGFPIHSNYSIFLPQPDGTNRPISRRVSTFEDFDKVYEGYAVFDELWSWMDARSSMSGANMFLSDILLKSRKRHFNLILTAQHLSQLDVRIRNVTQYVIYPEAIITNPVTGERVEIKQQILKPVSLKPYLNYTSIHAYVCEPHPHTGFFNHVVDEFEFPLAPVAAIYNTDEEVAALGSGDLSKGIIREQAAADIIKELNTNPTATITVIPNSGMHCPDTFDIETDGCIVNGKPEGLIIYDHTSLKEGKYLSIQGKDPKKFDHVAAVRECPVYFIFIYEGKWLRVNAKTITDTEQVKINVPKIITKCEFLMNAK